MKQDCSELKEKGEKKDSGKLFSASGVGEKGGRTALNEYL